MPRSHAHPHPRRTFALPRWLSLAAGLVVVLGVLAGALHRHAPEESAQHPCVVCTLHHAPATPAAVVEPTPPAPTFERVAVAPLVALCPVAVTSGPTRAPPIA